MAEWPIAEIRRFMQRCDIRLPSRQPPGNRSRRWLIQEGLGSLDWINAVDVVRLQMLCKVVVDEARLQKSVPASRANAASKRTARKLEALEALWGHP